MSSVAEPELAELVLAPPDWSVAAPDCPEPVPAPRRLTESFAAPLLIVEVSGIVELSIVLSVGAVTFESSVPPVPFVLLLSPQAIRPSPTIKTKKVFFINFDFVRAIGSKSFQFSKPLNCSDIGRIEV